MHITYTCIYWYFTIFITASDISLSKEQSSGNTRICYFWINCFYSLMVLWSNFTFTLWTLNYDLHRKGPYCPSVICDSVVFIIHSGADCEIFSMIWLTWKHRLWICLSHVGRASRAAIIIAHPFTTKVHDQPFTWSFASLLKSESHTHVDHVVLLILYLLLSL